ncbi:MAG: DinB family protein [candidate division Zixibacteria bacterium]
MTTVEHLLSQRKMFFEGTEMIIAGIKPEMFDISPMLQLMTFGEQINHISVVEADLLGETAGALKLEKIPFDYKQSGNLLDAISQWKRIHALGDEFVGKLDDEKLDFRFLTVSHVHVSVAYMINTVIEHEIHHRGELIAYFRMLKQEPPKRWRD